MATGHCAGPGPSVHSEQICVGVAHANPSESILTRSPPVAGQGLFSQKTCLTPSFPSRWPGEDGSPMFSELPENSCESPASPRSCKLPALPSAQHWAGPQGSPTNAQIQAEGRGCLGAQGLRGARQLVPLPGLGPLLSRSTFVDTAGSSLWGALQGWGGRRTMVRGGHRSAAQRAPPAHGGAVAGAAWGRGREGPPLGRGKQRHSFPYDPSSWPHPEWAVCGISIVLCRAGMWRPDPGPPSLAVWRGGGAHSTEAKGADARQACGQVCGEEGACPTHPQAPDPCCFLPSPMP